MRLVRETSERGKLELQQQFEADRLARRGRYIPGRTSKRRWQTTGMLENADGGDSDDEVEWTQITQCNVQFASCLYTLCEREKLSLSQQ